MIRIGIAGLGAAGQGFIPAIEAHPQTELGAVADPVAQLRDVARDSNVKAYETIAYAKGFLMVSASPLTRSSHHAGDDFARLKSARASRIR